jgi:hypothetical protein
MMRAPDECASWEWELDGFGSPGLALALMAASRMSVLLRERELLDRTVWNGSGWSTVSAVSA